MEETLSTKPTRNVLRTGASASLRRSVVAASEGWTTESKVDSEHLKQRRQCISIRSQVDTIIVISSMIRVSARG